MMIYVPPPHFQIVHSQTSGLDLGSFGGCALRWPVEPVQFYLYIKTVRHGNVSLSKSTVKTISPGPQDTGDATPSLEIKKLCPKPPARPTMMGPAKAHRGLFSDGLIPIEAVKFIKQRLERIFAHELFLNMPDLPIDIPLSENGTVCAERIPLEVEKTIFSVDATIDGPGKVDLAFLGF
jgi:hypothetical protein